MKLNEIIALIENTAPKNIASEWDNVGIMVGDNQCEINKVLLTLDVTPDVVKQAIDLKCELIISHHPFIFSDLKSIDYSSAVGSMIRELVHNDICVYSCHTNMDSADRGINGVLADMFRLSNIAVLDTNPLNENVGIGRIGDLTDEMTLFELCQDTKKILGTPHVKVVAKNINKKIRRVCVASGSCGDLIELAYKKAADVIITSDVKYHQALNAIDLDVAVIDAGHFPTEFLVTDIFKSLLQATELELVIAQQKDCFEYV